MHSEAPSETRSHRWLPWARAALAIYWLLLFTVTHLPRLPKPPGPPYIDKIGHFIAYAVLAILCLVYLRSKRQVTAATYVRLLALLAVYAAIDELLQIPVGRSCELFDWFADVTGAMLGMAFVAGLALVARTARRTPNEIT